MPSCIRHLKTLQLLPQSKCRLRCYLFEFISARFFCLAPSWCDFRKSILLSCTFTVTIIFLFEVDTIIWLPRSKYCYNLFSESDCHHMAKFYDSVILTIYEMKHLQAKYSSPSLVSIKLLYEHGGSQNFIGIQ